MTWHATGKCMEPGKMQHPVDGRAWKNFDTNQSYSMWPMILTTYNLPSWLCIKESSFMLTLLIPGPKSPGKDIDVYLRPLIDDLKDLWANPRVKTIDVAIGQKFNMRGMVLWTINDFLLEVVCLDGVGKVTRHALHVMKTLYLCVSLEFNGEKEEKDPPREFGRDQIQAQLARLPTCVKGKHPKFGGAKIKRHVLVELNWTKRSIFYALEYWSFITLKHNLDVMHVKKNVLESILNNLLRNDKSKDTAKTRQDLKRLGIQSGLWLGQNKNKKCSKPQAAYSFTLEDGKKFCQFIKGVKLPDGFEFNFKYKFTDNATNITGLKSHDCHIMMQRLLPYGLQQYLPQTSEQVIDILCNLELIYRPAFFDIMIHLVIHLPLEAINDGLICPQWMYPFERFMKKLKNYVRNKAKPKGSIAEGYVAKEALTFGSHYFWDVIMKFNRPDRNVDCPPLTCLSCTTEMNVAQLNGICWSRPDGEMHYGQLEKILEFSYLSFNCCSELSGSTLATKHTTIRLKGRRTCDHKKFSNEGVIMVEDDPNVIHVDNSSNLALSTSLNDLEITALHIDGQSIDVDALQIVDVDEDDDIFDEEDPIPHDLADSDDEDLFNLDIDDGVNVVYSSEEED
nr:hypothetical protein [Tanacetum cinerariifolium]